MFKTKQFKLISSITMIIFIFVFISNSVISKASNLDNTYDDFSISKLENSIKNTSVKRLSSSKEVSDYLLDTSYNTKLNTYDDNANSDLEATGVNPSLPTRIDNSATKYFPSIGNQDELDSCNSWAFVYYQMTYTVNKALNRDASNPANVFSPTWVYNMTNKGLNMGTYAIDVLKVLSQVGAAPSSMVPIETKDTITSTNIVPATKDLWLEASKYKVKEFYTIGPEQDGTMGDASNTEYTDEDIEAIKQALALGEVLTVSTYPIRWHETKIKSNAQVPANDKYVGQSIITRSSGFNYSAHRMTIVGYDDEIWVDINKNKKVETGEMGAFKLANSWGRDKGNDGFIWMSYDAVKINSSVDTSKIRNMLRTTGIYYVIGYSVDVDTTDENYYAALDIETSDLESLQVTITATANDGTSTTYEPAPFSNGLKHGFGPYPFNCGDNKNRGQFYIDLSNVIDGLNESNFDTYTWNFNIKDTSPNIDIIIHSLKTYNKSTDTYSSPYNDKTIILNNNSYTASSL